MPDKHLVVSRRDAVFNQAYFPARVGKTMLTHTKTIKTDLNQSKTEQNDLALSETDSKSILNDPKTVQNESKTTDKKSLDAQNPPKLSPQADSNSLKLLLDCDSIIRASTKIEKAAPHIYESAGVPSTTKPGLGGEPPSKRVYRRKTWYPRIPQREGRTTGPALRRFYDLQLSASACSVPLTHPAGHVSVKRNYSSKGR